jgi:hypothetical protein
MVEKQTNTELLWGNSMGNFTLKIKKLVDNVKDVSRGVGVVRFDGRWK